MATKRKRMLIDDDTVDELVSDSDSDTDI